MTAISRIDRLGVTQKQLSRIRNKPAITRPVGLEYTPPVKQSAKKVAGDLVKIEIVRVYGGGR